MEKLYTIKEAADYLHKSAKTIGDYTRAGIIRSYSGRPVLIPESAIKEFLNKRTRRAII